MFGLLLLKQLSTALVHAPVLGILDFSKPFLLKPMLVKLDLVLCYFKDSHPIAYLRKAVCAKKPSSVESPSLVLHN